MRLHDLARAAAAFTLAWAAFAQLPGKSHEAAHVGDAPRAWPIPRPRLHRPSPPPVHPPPTRERKQDAPTTSTIDVL